MATYETILTIPQPLEDTFAFVSDFRNAARWDPRTYEAVMATDGPIGVGTCFMLTGGMLRQDVVQRLHLPAKMAGMPLPYNVIEFDAPNEFVLVGESRMVRYRDHLEFSTAGNGTRLRYYAELELKGVLAVGEPLLKPIFKRIGDDATRSLPAAVIARN